MTDRELELRLTKLKKGLALLVDRERLLSENWKADRFRDWKKEEIL
jgi:hypothetical protein